MEPDYTGQNITKKVEQPRVSKQASGWSSNLSHTMKNVFEGKKTPGVLKFFFPTNRLGIENCEGSQS